MSLRFSPDVRVAIWTEQLGYVVLVASVWSLRTRVDVEVISIDDSAAGGSPTSMHGYSLAVDVSTASDKPHETELLAEYLRRTLEPQYTVAWEGTHLHVEWNAHRGQLFRMPN